MEQKKGNAIMSQLTGKNAIITALLVIIIAGGIYLFSGHAGETVEVTSFTPTGEIEQGTNFTVEFSKAIVSDSLVNKSRPDGPLSFEPPLQGRFSWIAPNKLRFYPDVMLKPSTEYVATLAAPLSPASIYLLDDETVFAFNTKRLRVNSGHLSYEYASQEPDRLRLVATLEFNYEVEPKDLVDFVALKFEDGEDIEFGIVTTGAARIMQLQADQVRRGENEQRVQLTIRKGLNCIGGNLALERDYIKPLGLPGQEDLRLVRMSPKKSSASQGYIALEFNLPIDAQKAKEFIALDPPIDFGVSAKHHYLNLRGDFKMGSAYQVRLRKGLLAIDGTPLEKDISNRVSFIREHIPPQIDFVGEGFYLTRDGNLNVGLSTINVNKVSLEIEKVYANNVTHLLNQYNLSSRYSWVNLPAMGRRLQESELVVQSVENEEIITAVDIRQHIASDRKGIYRLTARMSDQRWRQTSKWVIATNMGIVSKQAGDDLWVWVNQLADVTPVAGARIDLISQNNQTLVTARTNSDGIAVIKNYKSYADNFTPYLITATAGEDMSFVELTKRRVPTSDFDVGGKQYLQHGYEAFLYTERGVYRPGETSHLAAIVRGDNASVPSSFPVLLRVRAPDGRILNEQRAMLNREAACQFDIEIPGYARTGKYVAMLLLGDDREIGRSTFNVEEFVPDRMKVTLSTEKETYGPGDEIGIDVTGMTLFGPPAASRRVQAIVELEHFEFKPPRWNSFIFSDSKRQFAKTTQDLGEQRLNANGKYAYSFKIPSGLKPPSSLRGIVSTTVLEPGGRGVSAYKGVIIHPYAGYIGLRQAQEGYAEPERETKMEYVVVAPDGESEANHTVEITFYRIYWQSILKQVDSQRGYRYVSEKVEQLADRFELNSEPGVGSFEVLPKEYGQYRVVATDRETGASASLTFYASGWGYAPWAMDNPDRIEIDFDKQTYKPGEVAEVQVRAPFSGKLLLTVERDKVLSSQVVELEENTATVEVPVLADYKPNVYISAHLIRSTDGLQRDMPVRAFGVAPLTVETEENRLGLELSVPSEVRPRSPLKVKYKVSGSRGRRVFVTVAAVDEGICQLTEFETPDPHNYFFGKKRLSVETFDIYGVVLPEITSSSLTSTGGDVEAARKRQLTPVSVTRVKPVAFWSGLLESDRNGNGMVTFNMPQFNGSVRIMAVAFVGDRFGNAQQNVFVREPIVLTPTFPRFISSTDEFTVPVTVFNGTGGDATIEVALATQGPVTPVDGNRKSVAITQGQEGSVHFKLQAANATGKVKFNLSASGGGESASMSVDVPLRPPTPSITLSGYGSVEAGKPQRFTFPSDWHEGTAEFALTVSAFPAVQFAGSLQYLLRYPHGCIEQTTSKVFPLLAFNEIARVAEPELFNKNSADYYVEQGIAKLEGMQLTSGGFSYWPGGDLVNNWGSVYASHFLVEARKSGYIVSDRVYDKLLEALASTTRSYRLDDPHRTQVAVYACYILSLAGQPDKSTMLYLKNNALDRLSQYSKFQLAGAFGLSGDLQTARSLLPNSLSLAGPGGSRETGRNFNSPVRAQAIMLEVLAEVDADHAMVPVLVKNLSNAASQRGRWHTTQENAYAFLALGKILKKQTRPTYEGKIAINGQQFADFTTDDQRFSSSEWAGKDAVVTISGSGTCYTYWRAQGIPAKLSIDEFDRDLQVRRRYLDKNGNLLQLDQIKQGELVIAEVSVKALNENLKNVAVVDMLPAGLEIENPRLQSRRAVDWIGNKAYRVQHMDVRDDRMVIFGTFRYNRPEKFYYGLRAVTQGSFILPPVRAEAMYAPEKTSVASSGRIVVGPQ